MQVSTATQTNRLPQNSQPTDEKTTTGTLDYSAFLKLLIAELKNQDPTKPMDSAQYIAQLASFSNVEQSIKLNNKLDMLVASQALAQGESLIGRTVTSADGTVSGEVSGLRMLDSSVVLLLEGGKELDLGPGIKVSR